MMRHRLVMASLSGVLISAAHIIHPVIAPLAATPLLVVLVGATMRQAFYLGLCCGAIEALGLLGLMHAGWRIFLPLVLLYALCRMAFCLLYTWFSQTTDPLRLGLVGASAWVLVEWTHAALPGSLPTLLGDSQVHGIFLPLARIGGTYLVTFQLVWIGAVVAQLITRPPANTIRAYGASVGLLVIMSLGPGGLTRATAPQVKAPTRTAAIIQGGIPIWLYDAAKTSTSWGPIPQRVYSHLTSLAPPADLTVWPETAAGTTWGTNPRFEQNVQALAESRGPLLIGSIRHDAGQLRYNAGILVTDQPPQFADKKRLALGVEADLTVGTTNNILTHGDMRLGLIFCLESVVPQYARNLAGNHQANVLVVLAEGAQFGRTTIGRTHAQRSVLRAVETGRWLLHAGQHGYSTVISPDGKTRQTLEPFAAASLLDSFEPISPPTPYTQWGDAIVRAALAILLWVQLGQRNHKN